MAHKFTIQAGTAGAGADKERPGPLGVEVEDLGEGRFRLLCDGKEEIVHARRLSDSATGVTTWSLVPEGGGPQHQIDIEGALPDLRVSLPSGDLLPIKLEDARAAAIAAEARRPAQKGPAELRAPMPGKVVKVLCKPGDTVQAGQGVVIIEAMKMENELRAPRDGVVQELRAAEGQSVDGSTVLVTLA